MKIALAQINTTIGAFAENREKILEYARAASDAGAGLVVFPELSLCGYPPMDLLDHETFVDENEKSLRILQAECPPELAVVVGYVAHNRDLAGKPLRNMVAVIHGGRIVHRQAKTLLPTYDVFDETRYFEPATVRTVFELDGIKFGVAICEDIWWEAPVVAGTRYPVDPVQELLDLGASVILAPSASPFYAEKLAVRLDLISQIGRTSGVPVVYVNAVGGNDNLIFDGYSMVTDASGSLVHRAPGFAESLTYTDLPAGAETRNIAEIPTPEKYDEIRHALVLGIRDYLRKCGFSRVHLGLSGGVDSAIVTVLAVDAIGPENVKVFLLPSKYSSSGSVTDSERLVENLGIEAFTVPIGPVFDACLAALDPFLADGDFGLTEENIQARIRGGLILMAYSNKTGSLLLTTGNKSELATGYCTLYGDMCGGLSVIGDLFKTEVYALAERINAGREIIPRSIIDKPPSAELRPDQKDEDSLPPYPVLDEILRLYLLESKTGDEIIAAGFDEATVRDTLKLVGRAEHKRRQAAPVLKVSPRAFGTGRRMPIARAIYEA